MVNSVELEGYLSRYNGRECKYVLHGRPGSRVELCLDTILDAMAGHRVRIKIENMG